MVSPLMPYGRLLIQQTWTVCSSPIWMSLWTEGPWGVIAPDDYLTTKEKIIMANSRAEVTKAKGSRLRKDLIEAMDQVTEAKAKLKDISDQLRAQRMLIVNKDEKTQLVKQKIFDEHENVMADFQGSDAFRPSPIQKEMMADEDTERAKADGQAEEEGPKDAQATPLDEPLTNPLIDQVTNPNVINLTV
nr:hypothetical protein CFP56_14287 [Quercus suber]